VEPGERKRAFAHHDPRGAAARLGAGVLAGIVTAYVLPAGFELPVRFVAGWDAGALTLLTLIGAIVVRATVSETRRRAAAEDPGRKTVWVLVSVACAFSVFAATVVLRSAKTLAPERSGVLVALCLLSVVAAWALTHAVYTLRYAHLFYRDGHDHGHGLVFPGEHPPDDMDFAYFAFTIGMTFQVSDVVITGRAMRRAVLVHSLLSFAYNTVILALALNLTFGLFG
jgi:uncharacterized membrane protein